MNLILGNSMFWAIVHMHCGGLLIQLCYTWLNKSKPHIPTVKTSESVQLLDIFSWQICSWSWVVSNLLSIFFFPLFWYRLLSVLSVQRILFQDISEYENIFIEFKILSNQAVVQCAIITTTIIAITLKRLRCTSKWSSQ